LALCHRDHGYLIDRRVAARGHPAPKRRLGRRRGGHHFRLEPRKLKGIGWAVVALCGRPGIGHGSRGRLEVRVLRPNHPIALSVGY
jgi:hypothetical protein